MSRTSPPARIDDPRECVSIKYTCVCGEQVTVYRLASGTRYDLPPVRTVTCKNGHVATFTPPHFAFLDWTGDE